MSAASLSSSLLLESALATVAKVGRKKAALVEQEEAGMQDETEVSKRKCQAVEALPFQA
jgi:hypothetical protein